MTRAALSAALLSAVLAIGCGSKRERIPTERLLVTKVPAAPALSEPAAAMNADRAVHWGEAYFVRDHRPAFAWTGMFDGRPAQRTGLVEVSRGMTDVVTFAFRDDFLDAEVPTTAWLCGRIAPRSFSSAECADRLLRTIAAESTLLAYIPCWQADCPLSEMRDGVITGTTVPALSDLRVVFIDERPVVLAWSHWIRGREWTGQSLLVLHLAPPLQRAGEISLSETDARDPAKVVYWLGGLEIQSDGLRVRGRRSVREGASNVEISGTNVDERWGFVGADGKLVKR